MSVSDRRPEFEALNERDRLIVGWERNGLGEQTIPNYLAREPIEITLRKAVEAELFAQGLLLKGPPGPQMVIEIHEFFNEFKNQLLITTFSFADLDLDVTARSTEGGETKCSRHIVTHAEKLLSLVTFAWMTLWPRSSMIRPSSSR